MSESIKHIEEVIELVNKLPSGAKEEGVGLLNDLLKKERESIKPTIKTEIKPIKTSKTNNKKARKTKKVTFSKTFYPSQDKPWVILKNRPIFLGFETEEERDEAFEIGKKTGWNKARMLKLPEYITWGGDNMYHINIPGTDIPFRSTRNINGVNSFLEWINDAMSIHEGIITFPKYFSVTPYKMRDTMGWRHRNPEVFGLSFRKLEENLRKKGIKLTKSYGFVEVDLRDYI